MAIPISGLFTRVQTILQDALGTRWDESELLRWFNDGRREMAIHRPAEFSRRLSMTLTPGALQYLPTEAHQLLRLNCNLKDISPRVPGRSITQVDERVLNAMNPGWQDTDTFAAAKEVVHYTFSTDEPDVFQVFPPNDGTGLIELTGAVLPAEATNSSEPLGVRDIFANALADYVLYRCFSKDSDHPGNAQRAGGHYQAFASAMGIQGTTEEATTGGAA